MACLRWGVVDSGTHSALRYNYPGVPNPLADDRTTSKHLANPASGNAQFGCCISYPYQTHNPYSTVSGTILQHPLVFRDEGQPVPAGSEHPETTPKIPPTKHRP